MKVAVLIALSATALLAGSALTTARPLDESTCETGAVPAVPGIAGAINALDERLVACVNYLQGRQRAMAGDLLEMKARIAILEAENKRR